MNRKSITPLPIPCKKYAVYRGKNRNGNFSKTNGQ